MKILLLNPNSSELVTERLAAEARRCEREGLQIDVRFCENGPKEIVTARDELTAGYLAVRRLETEADRYDGAVIGCFADPGLPGARAAMGKPVAGFLESSLIWAGLMGLRYSIIASGGYGDRSIFTNDVSARGYLNRLASVRCLHSTVEGAAKTDLKQLAELAELCRREDGADVVILGCAGFAGLGRVLSQMTSIPVVDGVMESVLLAESMVRRWEAGKWEENG